MNYFIDSIDPSVAPSPEQAGSVRPDGIEQRFAGFSTNTAVRTLKRCLSAEIFEGFAQAHSLCPDRTVR